MIIDNKIESTSNAYKLPRGSLSMLVFVFSMSVQGNAYSQENQNINTWSINQKKAIKPDFVEADEELKPQSVEPLSIENFRRLKRARQSNLPPFKKR